MTTPPPPPGSNPPPGYPPPPGQGGFGGPPPYGAAPYGGPQMGGSMPALATWGQRALGGLIDFVGPGIVAGILFTISHPLGFLADLLVLAWALYNAYLGGETGQSYGKKIAHIRLLAEVNGQPIGGGLGIGRYFVHILDSIACYLGWLWPLWDNKHQTFADKLIHTVVVVE